MKASTRCDPHVLYETDLNKGTCVFAPPPLPCSLKKGGPTTGPTVGCAPAAVPGAHACASPGPPHCSPVEATGCVSKGTPTKNLKNGWFPFGVLVKATPKEISAQKTPHLAVSQHEGLAGITGLVMSQTRKKSQNNVGPNKIGFGVPLKMPKWCFFKGGRTSLLGSDMGVSHINPFG